MDKNGQLTFNDDIIVARMKEALQLIEEGGFDGSAALLNGLLAGNISYPGLQEAYRIARFWNNRKSAIMKLPEGMDTANFLMREWSNFEAYSAEKSLVSSSAYKSIMRYVFFKASENYKLAFKKNQDPRSSYDLLVNLGICFLKLGEYGFTIETLEYASANFPDKALLISILAESYYQTGETHKALLLFKEAFLIDPSEIDLSLIKSPPVLEMIELINKNRKIRNVREWIPVYAYLKNIFFVRKNLYREQVEKLKNDVYSLELSYQQMEDEYVENSNILPRLINKYLWLLDYYEFQKHSTENIYQIKDRLKSLDGELFVNYFN